MLDWEQTAWGTAQTGYDAGYGGASMRQASTVTVGAGCRFDLRAAVEPVRRDGGLVHEYVGSRLRITPPSGQGHGELVIQLDWHDLDRLVELVKLHTGVMRARERDLAARAAAEGQS